MIRSKHSKKNVLINLLVSAVALFVGLTVAEFYFRMKDKQPLLGELPFLYSPLDPELKAKVDSASFNLSKEYGIAADIASLYQFNPIPGTFGTKDSIRFASDDAERNSVEMRVWNKNFLSQVYCDEERRSYFSELTYHQQSLYVFKPYDSTYHPVYRYFPNSASTLKSNKLRFNDFGWGGDSISFHKPDNTIRMAFLGASTSQSSGCDFAYTDYIGRWLNEWARQKGINVHFEIINAARIAQQSSDFLAIMKYEIAPVEPDMVIYYEGRNQFSTEDVSCPCLVYDAVASSLLRALRKYALVRRIVSLGDIDVLQMIENRKVLKNKFSKRVLVSDPDINSPYLPLNLPEILANLDSIKELNREIGSTFAVCSFAMFTNEEILSESLRYGASYSYWMHSMGPMRLKNIAQLNEFQNRVFSKYCENNNVIFIDVAKNLTRLPEGFLDGIHLHCDAMKYHAWIVFLDLLSFVEEQISNGALPKKSSQRFASHPYLGDTFEKVLLPYQCK